MGPFILKSVFTPTRFFLFLFQFFCSMAATFSLNFFLSGINSNSWGYFYQPGLIDFGEFSNKV